MRLLYSMGGQDRICWVSSGCLELGGVLAGFGVDGEVQAVLFVLLMRARFWEGWMYAHAMPG